MNLARWGKLALVILVLLLLAASTRGYYSYDFFTLWGVHAKTIWSTGIFFTPGADLSLEIAYQSLLGSVVGMLVRILSPTYYPDWIYGLVNSLLITFFAILAASRAHNHKWQRAFFLFTLLVLIRPAEFIQMTFGGYADLLGVLCLSLAWLSFAEKSKQWIVFAVAMVAFKPTLWFWLPTLGLAMSLSAPKFNLRPLLKFFAVGVLTIAIIRVLYPTPAETAVVPMAIRLTSYSWLERLKLPFSLLLANGGLGFWAALTAALELRVRKNRLPLIYFVLAFANLIAFYTLVMDRTGYELFASISRYSLALSLPILVASAIASPLPQWFHGQSKLKPVVYTLIGLIFFARAIEETGLIRDRGFAHRFELCPRDHQKPWCSATEKVRQQSLARPECTAWHLNDAFLAPYKNQDWARLQELKIVYTALPTRVLLSSQLVRKGEIVCDLAP